MERVLDYFIANDIKSIKINHYLRKKGYSVHNLAQLKQSIDSVYVNQKPRYLNERLYPGDHLQVYIRETEDKGHVHPVHLPLNILYEDEDLLIMNKPAGMPTHPSAKNHDNSLASGLTWYYQSKGENFRFRCSNRLDRDTSGLTIVAKHMLSGTMLSDMVQKRQIHREYLAIVRGYDIPDTGIIDAPLGRKEGSIIERTIDFETGESARTHYRVLKRINGHSLVALTLETGRTHQIRIHMKYIGHPLIGDYLYHPDMEHIQRQALHSWHVAFKHPITGKDMDFYAPLPEDMAMIINPPTFMQNKQI